MKSGSFWWRSCAVTLGAVGLVAGCIVVQPLEDYPTESASKAGRGGSGGGGGAGGSGGTSGSGNSGGCSTNADCKDAGTADEPYVCRKSDARCIALRQPDCPLAIAHDIDNPNAIVIGAFATLSDTNPERNPFTPAYELALEELSGNLVGGLPKGKNERQPLSMVVCYNDADKLDSAMAHMVDSVGVKAILAHLKPGELRQVYGDHSKSDLFYLSPVPVTETVSTLTDDGKVWGLLGQPSDFVPTYAKLLPMTVAWERARHALKEGEPLKVALVSTQDAFDSELATKLKPVLNFNGVPLDDNITAGNYMPLTVKSTSAADIANAAAELDKMKPHLVISAASEVMTMFKGVIDSTEELWIDGPMEPKRPMWLLSPYNAGALSNVTRSIVALRSGFDKDTQNRFIGVSIAGPEDNSAQFAYQTRLGSSFGNINKDTANYYDAAYFLAYAMYAAGSEEPLSGTTIARGMKRLISGNSLLIGPETILDTFAALGTPDTTVQLESTLGPPTFDAKTGVRPIDGSVFCFTGDMEQVEPVMDSVRYDPKLDALREVDPFCIAGFIQ